MNSFLFYACFIPITLLIGCAPKQEVVDFSKEIEALTLLQKHWHINRGSRHTAEIWPPPEAFGARRG